MVLCLFEKSYAFGFLEKINEALLIQTLEQDPGLEVSLRPACEVRSLETRWKSLQVRADCSFFNTWIWIGAWLGLTQSQPFVFSVSHKGTDLAMAVITKGEIKKHFVKTTRLYINRPPLPDESKIFPEYTDLLTDRTFQIDFDGILSQALIQAGGSGDSIGPWNDINLSGTLSQPKDYPALGLFAEIPVCRQAPWIDLTRVRALEAGHLGLLSSNSRHQIRRSKRLFEKAGPMDLTSASSIDVALEWLNKLIVRQRDRRHRLGQKSSLEKPFVRRFLEQLILSGWESGSVEMLKLSTPETSLGYTINLIHGGVVANYQSGFSSFDDNKLKPGLICHSMSADYYAAKGARAYNLLAGASQYKISLSTDIDTLHWATIQRPHLPFTIERQLRNIFWK